MNFLKILLFSIILISLAITISLFTVMSIESVPTIQNTEFGCTAEFWKNNLDLWKVVDVDYDDDFDETFGTDYFEPNITLKHAINLEGSGLYHLASIGTTAYLDSLVNPYADSEILREHVHDNHVHALDAFVNLCEENT